MPLLFLQRCNVPFVIFLSFLMVNHLLWKWMWQNFSHGKGFSATFNRKFKLELTYSRTSYVSLVQQVLEFQNIFLSFSFLSFLPLCIRSQNCWILTSRKGQRHILKSSTRPMPTSQDNQRLALETKGVLSHAPLQVQRKIDTAGMQHILRNTEPTYQLF